MRKKQTVFSLVREQSNFMTVIIAVLTFLAVIALGIALSIGTGVVRWNNQWRLNATIQTLNSDSEKKIDKIISDNDNIIKSVHRVSESEMKNLMKSWVSDSNTIQNYLPNMWEIETKSTSDLETLSNALPRDARMITHASALHNQTSTGWKLVAISTIVLVIMLGAIGACILYIAQNTAILHKRELEILNQIGANDSFITKQMKIIVAKISVHATAIGFFGALPILWFILAIAHGTRTGLMAMIALNTFDWCLLCALPIAIIIFAITITKRTTIHILENE